MDYKPTDEAAALCGFDAPQATVTILYLNDTGTEGTLTLTFGSENLDQTGYYVRMEGIPPSTRWTPLRWTPFSLWRRMA